MISEPNGPFVNLSRLNIDKYAANSQINRNLFEYVFYYEGDMRMAHQVNHIISSLSVLVNYHIIFGNVCCTFLQAMTFLDRSDCSKKCRYCRLVLDESTGKELLSLGNV